MKRIKTTVVVCVLSLVLAGFVSEAFLAKGNLAYEAHSLRRIRNSKGAFGKFVRNLADFDKGDVLIVGGKAANTGELIKHSTLPVPEGYVVTVDAFKKIFEVNSGLKGKIDTLIDSIDWDDPADLDRVENETYRLLMQATENMPAEITGEIYAAYAELESKFGKDVAVKVRSTGTNEDAPGLSWAGRWRTSSNVRGIEQVVSAFREDIARTFNHDALDYAHENGVDPKDFVMAVMLQRNVRSGVPDGKSYIAFGLDDVTGFRAVEGMDIEAVVAIGSAYGDGEGLVGGTVDQDEDIFVRKDGKWHRIYHKIGRKENMLLWKEEGGLEQAEVPLEERNKEAISYAQKLEIAENVYQLNLHYGQWQDTEGVVEPGEKLYIVQSRGEDIWSLQDPQVVKFKRYEFLKTAVEGARALAQGDTVGGKVGDGKGRVVVLDYESDTPVRDQAAAKVKPGTIIVARRTDPSLLDYMKLAAQEDPETGLRGAVITEIGGTKSHAAIVARSYGIPTVIGIENATSIFRDGEELSISGITGHVYQGLLEGAVNDLEEDMRDLPVLKSGVKVGTIPLSAKEARDYFAYTFYKKFYGIGLKRLEIDYMDSIKLHPYAILNYDKLDPKTKAEVDEVLGDYTDPRKFFVDKLSESILSDVMVLEPGQRVIVRTSDFKTNEYRETIGGSVERVEENPMMGYRGIGRDLQEEEFNDMQLEGILRAWAVAPEKVAIMFPVVRTPEELARAKEIVARKVEQMGLSDLGVPTLVMMFEVPVDVFRADEFMQHINGISIGSNDLTQFWFAVDRDSNVFQGLVDYSELNQGLIKALGVGIHATKRNNIFSGICGQAPSLYPDEMPGILLALGIDSISVTNDVFPDVVRSLAKAEDTGQGQEIVKQIDFSLRTDISGVIKRPKGKVKVISSDELHKSIGEHPQYTIEHKGENGYFQEIYQRVKSQLESTRAAEIVYKTSAMLSTEAAQLEQGRRFETEEDNPLLGVFGMYKMVNGMKEEFLIELSAVMKAAKDTGKKINLQLEMVRTLNELKAGLGMVDQALAGQGLIRGKDVKIGMSISVPNNLGLIDKFINEGELDFVATDELRLAQYLHAIEDLSLINRDELSTTISIVNNLIESAASRHGIVLFKDSQLP